MICLKACLAFGSPSAGSGAAVYFPFPCRIFARWAKIRHEKDINCLAAEHPKLDEGQANGEDDEVAASENIKPRAR
jgi:hypothetical protein